MSKHQYIIENSDSSVFGSLILTLKPKSARDIFNFKPGQYAMLSFYDQVGKLFINHPFSIASRPNQSGKLVFGVKILGKFTQNLQKLAIGSQVEILGPFGDFVFNPKKHNEAVFIAGGIGITPFISAAEYATANNLTNNLTLLYSVRTLKDALFYDRIKELSRLNSNFKAKLKLTQETLTNSVEHCESGYITKEVISETVGLLVNKDFFICGPEKFMKAMENNLLALGVPSKKIHQEAFNVTPNLSLGKNFFNLLLAYGLSLSVFLAFLGFIVPESKDITPKEKTLNLINATLNNRRNDIIASKNLLLTTINSGTANNTVSTQTIKQVSNQQNNTSNTNQQATPKPASPAVSPKNNVNTPVQKVTPSPVINSPIVTPQTRVS